VCTPATTPGRNQKGRAFWLKVRNNLKACRVQDIILCGDGLKGLPEGGLGRKPKADMQLCVVRQIRNATKFVSFKDRKEFCRDVRPIYSAPASEAAEQALDEFSAKWGDRYPTSAASWKNNWPLGAWIERPAGAKLLSSNRSHPIKLKKYRVLYAGLRPI